MKVALYARVSTHDQDERLQLPRLRSVAQLRGYEIAGEYSDEASGRDSNRPGWKALLSDARRGEFNAVLVVKLDRVMRSLRIFLRELEDFRSMNIQIISLDYGDLNPANASGKLLIQFMAAIAEWEREINSERTREALRQKAAQGIILGRPRKDMPLHKIALLRAQEKPWREIAELTGIPESSIRGRKKEIEEEVRRIVEGS